MLSSIQLFATLMTIVLQAPLFMKLKIMKWVSITFSRGSYQTKDWTLVSYTASRFLTIWVIREALILLSNSQGFSEVVVSTSFPITTMLLCMFTNKWCFRIYYFASLVLGAFYFSLSISVSLSLSLKRFLRILATIYTMLLESVISSFSTAPWLFY